MITVAHVRTMAGYNRWQNESQYGAADRLSDAQRKEQRGAFSARSTARSTTSCSATRSG